MIFLKYLIRLGAIFSLIFSATGIAGAKGHNPWVNELRDQQAQLRALIEFKTEKSDLMRDLMAEGRTFVVLIPNSHSQHFADVDIHMGTRQEAQRALKIIALQQLINSGETFNQNRLENALRDMSRSLKSVNADFEREIARLQKEIDLHRAQWRKIENEIANLMQMSPTPSTRGSSTGSTVSGNITFGHTTARTTTDSTRVNGRKCVQLVGIVPSKTPLSQKASVPIGAANHSVSHHGKVGSAPLNVTLTWTAPPQRMCEDEEFHIRVTAKNATPAKSDLGLNYVGDISIDGKSNAIELVKCTNPITWINIEKNTAAVGPKMSNYTNSCTYKVKRLPQSDKPKWLVSADFGIHTIGAGKILYLYSTAP